MSLVLGQGLIVDVVIPSGIEALIIPPPVIEITIIPPSIPVINVSVRPVLTVIDSIPPFPEISIPALPGPPGPPGESGAGYIHTQNTPAATWTVIHNLDRYVSATVYVNDEIGLADAQHVDMNILVITFPSAVIGIVVIN